MKKILAALLMLALVAPAMADVAITSSFDNVSKNLTISFNPTAATVRGVAVTVTVTGGVVDAYVSSSFNTFVDYAFSTPGYTVGAGHPLALVATAGVATLPIADGTPFAVSVGYLDQAGAQAGLATAGTVAVLHIGSINALGGTVAVVANAARGGAVVGDTIGAVTVDGTTIPAQSCTVSQPTLVKAVNPGFVNTDVTSIAASATSSSGHALDYSFNWGSGAGAYGAATQTNTYAFTAAGSETVTVVAHCTVDGAVSIASAPMVLTREAIKSTATYVGVWRTWNRPGCWAFRKQCNGDAEGTLELTKPVMGKDLNLFKLAYNKADSLLATVVSSGQPGICADFEKTAELTKRVMGKDLTILKLYYNKAASLVPTCASTNLNFYTN